MKITKKAVIFIACILITSTLNSAIVYAADYTIVPNDSLYKLSLLFNTSVNTLKSDNQLNSDALYPGQVLSVPADLYTIKSGDSVYLIAKKYGIPLSSLRQANNKWDNTIYPGQKLIIPSIKPVSGSGTVISYSANEVNLLARLITAEAGGEAYEAMVGVGGVVVNRVLSPDWPSSITSVIYQVIGEYYQFTPVKNGHINNPPSDAALRAAWASLYGSDPSKDAMFYFDDSSTNQWMWSKTVTARIDSMVFVK